MKLKDGFMVRNIMDEYVVVPVGERINDFNGLITLNESGLFLWNCLEKDNSGIDELVDKLIGEYEVDTQTAKADVLKFIEVLSTNELLEQ